MKKILLIFVLLWVTTIATAQIKIYSGGWIGIGNDLITFKPANPGPEIGGYNGTTNTVINFWHSYGGWNKINAKNVNVNSDSTLKTDILPIENATMLLKQIQTYSYYFKADSVLRSDSIDIRKKEYGVLAQEVEQILPDIIDTAKGTMLVNYNAFIGILIAGFNEQQTQIETLQNIVVAQEVDIVALQETVYELQEIVYNCCENSKGMPMPIPPEKEPLFIGENAILYQNVPNPFSSNTEISCYLPETVSQAIIYVYNLQGVQLLDFPITQTGLNTIIVYASELPAGMYLYTLVVDNEIIDTKRMILTK